MPMPMPMIRTIPHVPLSRSLFAGPVSYGNLYHNPVHGNHRRPQCLPYHPTPVYAGQPAPSPKHPLSLDLRRSLGKPQGRELAVGGDLGLGVPQERVRIGIQQNVYFLYGVSGIAVQLQQGCISHRLMLLQGRAVESVGFRHRQAHT